MIAAMAFPMTVANACTAMQQKRDGVGPVLQNALNPSEEGDLQVCKACLSVDFHVRQAGAGGTYAHCESCRRREPIRNCQAVTMLNAAFPTRAPARGRRSARRSPSAARSPSAGRPPTAPNAGGGPQSPSAVMLSPVSERGASAPQGISDAMDEDPPAASRRHSGTSRGAAPSGGRGTSSADRATAFSGSNLTGGAGPVPPGTAKRSHRDGQHSTAVLGQALEGDASCEYRERKVRTLFEGAVDKIVTVMTEQIDEAREEVRSKTKSHSEPFNPEVGLSDYDLQDLVLLRVMLCVLTIVRSILLLVKERGLRYSVVHALSRRFGVFASPGYVSQVDVARETGYAAALSLVGEAVGRLFGAASDMHTARSTAVAQSTAGDATLSQAAADDADGKVYSVPRPVRFRGPACEQVLAAQNWSTAQAQGPASGAGRSDASGGNASERAHRAVVVVGLSAAASSMEQARAFSITPEEDLQVLVPRLEPNRPLESAATSTLLHCLLREGGPGDTLSRRSVMRSQARLRTAQALVSSAASRRCVRSKLLVAEQLGPNHHVQLQQMRSVQEIELGLALECTVRGLSD